MINRGPVRLPERYTVYEPELAPSAGESAETYRVYHPDGYADDEFPDGRIEIDLEPLDQVDEYPHGELDQHYVRVLFGPDAVGSRERVVFLALTELGRRRQGESRA